MSRTDLVMLEQDQPRVDSILRVVQAEANARFVLLLDRNGHQMACTGDVDGVDPAALASLAAGNVAATEGLARLVGESDFSSLFHEGRDRSLHVSLVAQKVIMLVVFDERSSLGLVRLRVQQRSAELAALVEEMASRSRPRNAVLPPTVVGEVSDADIDALFA